MINKRQINGDTKMKDFSINMEIALVELVKSKKSFRILDNWMKSAINYWYIIWGIYLNKP